MISNLHVFIIIPNYWALSSNLVLFFFLFWGKLLEQFCCSPWAVSTQRLLRFAQAVFVQSLLCWGDNHLSILLYSPQSCAGGNFCRFTQSCAGGGYLIFPFSFQLTNSLISSCCENSICHSRESGNPAFRSGTLLSQGWHRRFSFSATDTN